MGVVILRALSFGVERNVPGLWKLQVICGLGMLKRPFFLGSETLQVEEVELLDE